MNSLEPCLVYSDPHGRIQHCRSMSELYPGVQLMCGGDAVDGSSYSETQATLEWMMENNVEAVAGNHDWVLAAILNEVDPEKRAVWAKIWRKNHYHTLGSYGIKNFKNSENVPVNSLLEKADQLKEKMTEKGHMEYFKNLRPYFDGGNFIVVHAGFVLGKSLEVQKAELDACFGSDGGITDYGAEPIQIFDNGMTPYAIAKSKKGLDDSNKVLVTGHYHNKLRPVDRISDDGKRVRLASSYGDPQAPIHAWESWTGNVVRIYPKEPYRLL